jgi:D-specific alpha-keto acid dehydrogenase
VASSAPGPGPEPVGITVYGCEPDEAEAFATMSPRFGIVPTLVRGPAAETSVLAVPGGRGASVSHKSPVPGPVLRALRAAGVEHLSTRSIGVDHIDLAAADALGLTVDNVVYPPDGVADHTLMLILMAIRHAKAVIRAADRHDFRAGARGQDLRDLTVGVVGAGHIGAAVITRLRAFGGRVLAASHSRGLGVVADFVALADLLRASDVVTLHVPLNARTHHLIGPAQLAAMKPGAILVNTGRGALVDTGALLAALEGGRLGGAALDVLEGEEGIFSAVGPTSAVHHHPYLARLQRLPNVVITPHTAYYTGRALHATVEQTLLKRLRFERNRTDEEAHDRRRVRGLLRGA